MCTAVVVKLVVDMWLSAGPAASLPLALLLLQRSYASGRPSLRRRAFDLLANLMVGPASACWMWVQSFVQCAFRPGFCRYAAAPSTFDQPPGEHESRTLCSCS